MMVHSGKLSIPVSDCLLARLLDEQKVHVISMNICKSPSRTISGYQVANLCFMHSDALLTFLKGRQHRDGLEQCRLMLPSLDAV